MKLTAIILLTAGLTASANGHSQITLSEKNAPLPKVLKEIQRQTGYEFFYSFETLQKAGNVDVELKGVSIESALTTVLKGKHLGYEIIRKTVVIKELPAGIPLEDPSIKEAAPPPIDVKGRVINEKGEPTEGVSVIVKGTGKGTSTNSKGEFQLIGIDENATLVISGVSIESFEVKVNGRTELLLTAKVKAVMGEEIVINTGYQKLKPNETTGSAAYVGNDLLNRRVSTNLIERIENVIPGMLFTRNTSEPIIIRGRGTILGEVSPLNIK